MRGIHTFIAAAALLGVFGCESEELDYVGGGDKSDGLIPTRQVWPHGDVYLIVEASEEQEAVVTELHAAAADLELNTGVRVHFIDEPSEAVDGYYVVFNALSGDGTGGVAPVGTRIGGEAHSRARSVRHELGHIIGLAHTQNRVDRDESITIHTQYIREGFEKQFDPLGYLRLVGPYDTNSIMHYTSSAFSTATCAVISIGSSDPEECIIDGANYIVSAPEAYSDWNYSVIAASYCEPRFCGEFCAEAQRCETQEVQSHIDRLTEWELSSEGLAHAGRWPQHLPYVPSN